MYEIDEDIPERCVDCVSLKICIGPNGILNLHNEELEEYNENRHCAGFVIDPKLKKEKMFSKKIRFVFR